MQEYFFDIPEMIELYSIDLGTLQQELVSSGISLFDGLSTITKGHQLRIHRANPDPTSFFDDLDWERFILPPQAPEIREEARKRFRSEHPQTPAEIELDQNYNMS